MNDANLLDGWLDEVRLGRARHGTLTPDEAATLLVARTTIDTAAQHAGIIVDPFVLRIMAFTFMTTQVFHQSVSDLNPPDEGFGASIVAAMGAFMSVVVERLDEHG